MHIFAGTWQPKREYQNIIVYTVYSVVYVGLPYPRGAKKGLMRFGGPRC